MCNHRFNGDPGRGAALYLEGPHAQNRISDHGKSLTQNRSCWFGSQSHLANSTGQWLLRAQDTGGAFALHSGTMAPGTGAPLHVHTHEDETFYVIAGEVEATVGDDRQTLEAGDCIFLPRGIPHRLQNISSEQAQIIMLIQPAGLEEFFERVEQLSKTGPPSPHTLPELAAGFGIRSIPTQK
jgi:quercetin dioxygenase-like cupin family protein